MKIIITKIKKTLFIYNIVGNISVWYGLDAKGQFQTNYTNNPLPNKSIEDILYDGRK